jgi:hypothetical protein
MRPLPTSIGTPVQHWFNAGIVPLSPNVTKWVRAIIRTAARAIDHTPSRPVQQFIIAAALPLIGQSARGRRRNSHRASRSA